MGMKFSLRFRLDLPKNFFGKKFMLGYSRYFVAESWQEHSATGYEQFTASNNQNAS